MLLVKKAQLNVLLGMLVLLEPLHLLEAVPLIIIALQVLRVGLFLGAEKELLLQAQPPLLILIVDHVLLLMLV